MDIKMKMAIGKTIHTENLLTLLGVEMFDEASHYTSEQKKTSRSEAEQQVTECLKFLYLTSAYPDELGGLFIPVEQDIDDVWHYLILQTREYRNFCEEKLPGHFFIEHRGMSYAKYGEEPERETMIEEALRWLPLYTKTFGDFDEKSAPHWTMVRFLREHLGMTLKEINLLDSE